MRGAANGDRHALARLFRRHHRTVHSLCYRLTGDAAATDDLVQEAFLRVFRYGAGFDGRARFSTWLYRLVRNLCIDHMRARQRDERRRRRLDTAAEPAVELPADEDERLELVRRALNDLTPERREVLVLSRYHDLRYREIAEILEISLDAVKARAHRGLRDLRRIIKELERQA
ncbi:MAG: RNA polymerase sigma factor [Gemmatimonadetes bacterium]|nr:RNA polymerase sigma factor [Gemmatimonadota bacterium]NIS03249.1 RNA polymerase sigma factor [Gemmatimonadota bacterium]NIT69110.1 RNA polymerase sigma factor [Gemmatimonadota bacterium]NIU54502.1 sigma-70 family RNA polymerase sigma factor [Gemmatimonadota bacterium]NIV25585.1 sigma-70 family RNA polymerase sigma factor [Gemmatimonadota bacterium]